MALTGLGVACALGTGGSEVAARIARDLDAGRCGLRTTGDLRDRLPVAGFGIAEVDVLPLLKRKKDRKLLPRAAELALVAAAVALGADRPLDIGCFMGVGREPPDPDDTESSVLASMRGSQLDTERLATVGLDAYPPLAPLRTLPNLILAHVAIHLNLTGECATRAGEEAAGVAAVVEAFWAIAEGRSDVALAGAAESRVDVVSARDRCRLGERAPPGEAAAIFRLESMERAASRGAHVYAVLSDGCAAAGAWVDQRGVFMIDGRWNDQLGAIGCATGPLSIALQIASGAFGGWFMARERSGASACIAVRRWESAARSDVWV